MACRGDRGSTEFPMKILIDTNLPPTWVSVIEEAGHTAVHWSTIGSSNAPDRKFWHRRRLKGMCCSHMTLTSVRILAATDTEASSVIQIRTQDVTPHYAKDLLLNVIKKSYPRSSSRCIDFG